MNINHMYKVLAKDTSWSSSVKSAVKLAGMMLSIVPLVYGSSSVSTVKIITGYARNVRRMQRAQGFKGLAKYLKASYVMLQQAAGGYVIPAPWALGCNVARTRKGVPRLLNRQQRSLVIAGDVPTIRLWLSLLGLYRVIEFKGALKLSTITEPGKIISPEFLSEWKAWVPRFLEVAQIASGLSWKCKPSSDLTPYRIPVIRKAAPNTGGLASLAAIPLDIVRWALDPSYLEKLLSWVKKVDGVELIWGLKPLIKRISLHPAFNDGRLNPLEFLTGAPKIMKSTLARTWMPVTCLGKLGFKEEPGKIRVFAMVDILTQTVMLPLHNWIFTRLRPIPTDATFDQHAPIERLLGRMKECGRNWIASYDLSAATDRLPIVLQRDVLEAIMGKDLAYLWVDLLVGRAYKLPKIAKSYNLGFLFVRYAVGQPMGAYSSWAMLAVTHHAIVQMAAQRVYPGKRWFIWYLVLGDDVVIADKHVAAEYLKIMAEIGVEIGLAKCLISSTMSLEFAKRTYIKGTDCSPISLAEVLVARCNLASLDELVRKQLKYGVLRLASVARFAGAGYKVLGSLPVAFALNHRMGRMLAYLHRPGGVYSSPLWTWVTAVGPGRPGLALDGAYSIALFLWRKVLSSAISSVTKMEAQLPFFSLYSYSTGEHSPLTEEEKRLGSRGKTAFRPSYLSEGKSLTSLISVNEFNGFFTEWVAYPYSEQLRKDWTKANDLLRVHDPYTLPDWTDIQDIWSQVVAAEDSVSLFPKRPSLILRDHEVIPSRSRLMDLWRILRARYRRGVSPSFDLSTETLDPPLVGRRWTRGLGQDRLYMNPSVVIPTPRQRPGERK